MLLCVVLLLPLVEHFVGERRRTGGKIENDPAVLRLKPGKAFSPSMDQIGSCLSKRNLTLIRILPDRRESLVIDVQGRSHLMLF